MEVVSKRYKYKTYVDDRIVNMRFVLTVKNKPYYRGIAYVLEKDFSASLLDGRIDIDFESEEDFYFGVEYVATVLCRFEADQYIGSALLDLRRPRKCKQ